MIALTVSEYHFGSLAQSLRPQAFDRGARAAGEMMMPGKDVLEPLLLEDGERLAQPVEQRQSRRVGEIAGRVCPHLVAEIEIGLAALGVLHRRERLLARADEAEARRQHETLLRAGDGEVDAPLVEAEIDARDRAHAVDIEHGRMLGGVERAAHGSDVAGDAGGGLVMDDEHALDLVGLVGAQRLLDALGVGAGAPLLLLHDHLEPMPLGELDPQMAELAES